MIVRAQPELSRFEEAALTLGRLANEKPALKRVQNTFLHAVSRLWIRNVVARRTYVDGVDYLLGLQPDRGVVLAANHRSFFDFYIALLGIYDSGVTFPERFYFPVRANFFYERPAGLLINAAIGGLAMYPPIYRDRSKAALNKEALEKVIGFLQEPGSLVGMHPEGQRNKGDDPYTLLPAQPGVGEVILKAKPVVVPLFIGGLTNDFVRQARDNYRRDVRRTNPVILSFGQPVDYEEFTKQPPRAALAKRTSNKVRDAIMSQGERERELRAMAADGRLADDDPGWLVERRNRKR